MTLTDGRTDGRTRTDGLRQCVRRGAVRRLRHPRHPPSSRPPYASRQQGERPYEQHLRLRGCVRVQNDESKKKFGIYPYRVIADRLAELY